MISAFDRIVLRNEKLCQALKGSLDDSSKEENSNNNNNDTDDDGHKDGHHDDSPTSPDDGQRASSSSTQQKKPSSKEGSSSSSSSATASSRPPAPSLDETVRSLNAELTRENRNLNILVTSLHEKIHVQGLKVAELADTVDARELANDDLKSRIDELEMELNKSRTREKRMEEHFYDAREKLRDLQSNNGILGGSGGSGSSLGASGSLSSTLSTCAGGDIGRANEAGANSSLSNCKVEELKRELEEQRELALSRLAELEALNAEHKETLKTMEKYKLDLQCIPDLVIRDSAEYKSLQSHFSVLYNDSVALKTTVEEQRGQLNTVTVAHLRQIEQMESEELAVQKQLRTEMTNLEETISMLKKS